MKQFQSPNISKIAKGGFLNQAVIIVFAVMILFLVGGYFYTNSTNRGVSVDINLPKENIYPGDIFDMDVILSNNSQGTLSNIRLTLNFPQHIRLFENGDRVNEVRELEGEIGPGSLIKETYKVVVLPGGEGDDYSLEAKANYTTEAFSNDFERRKEKKIDIKIDEFKLELSTPNRATAGERFDVEMPYSMPDDITDSLDKILVLEGPSLSILGANLEQSAENEWLLEKGEDKKVTASISIGTRPADTFAIKAKMIVKFMDQPYLIIERESQMEFAGSSLALSVDLEDPKDFVSPSETLNYRVSYKNNTDVELKDAIIRAELVGDMFDLGSVETSGTFDSLSRTITWSSNRFGELRDLGKGEEGTFNVAVKVKPNFPSNTNDKNFTLQIRASIESPTVIQGTNTDRTSNFANSEVSVSGNVSVDARAYFRDAQSGILNEGPFPPKVGQATEYTIHWSLSNAGTDLDEVIVKAPLEDGVVFTGDVKGYKSTLPILDADNNEIVWLVGNLSAVDDNPEVVFQIRLTPGVGLLGQFAPLLGITSVSAKDTFTEVELLNTDSGLTTQLPDDATVGSNQGKVIQ